MITVKYLCMALCALFICTPAEADFSIWDCPYQCHGDADCAGGVFGRVDTADVAIINAVKFAPGGDWPAFYPDSFNYDARADFDRNFKVNDLDYDIIEYWYFKMPVPGDCGKKLELENMDSQCLLANASYTIHWIWHIYTQYVPMPGDEDYPGTFSLYYSTDEGQSWTYIATVSAQTSYKWLVPQVDSNDCMLEIVDDDHPGLIDITGFFQIHQCQGPVEGDLNNDCYVNIKDLMIVTEYWLHACSPANNWCEGADVDFSETIDGLDFASFAQNWYLCANPCDSNCLQ